ncbi:heat-inducible transcriptional repressor HrcA [Rothia sp. LK2588]|uniref:heat-inducible transcriptional repressor HrcA n=1 Tax=Rothia sp. LK2588 TaxID=3114369 RepID=UPI0034CFB647
MTQPRKHQVLRAIVEDFVRSREPVGSKALIERHNLKVSSATVRNDMALLEEEGLIRAPHASAGRIPTEKGYRYFVDEITVPRALTPAQKRAIHTLLDSSDSVEEVFQKTVRALSQLTHQVAVLQYSLNPVTTIRHIELVPVGDHQVLVMVISDTGRVIQKTATVEQYTEDDVQLLKKLLLASLAGHQLDAVNSLSTESADWQLIDCAPAVISVLQSFARQESSSKLLISGTSYLVESTPDFSQSVAPILEALEEQVTMLQLLNEMSQDARGFAVKIGTETAVKPLQETSVITSVYGLEDGSQLGVLGPTRMDYLQTTSTVRGVARYLAKILGTSP